ncbi:MAG TPA: cell division protein ZapA [Gammaproteobacteria bacterium]|jgi:cell division protein ZapA|nr:cell division protein ZapA [Gammaproteobacteria bacterium]
MNTTSMDRTVNVTIEILGKPYIIKCASSEQDALQKAAAFLNARMEEVKESGKAINVERIAIMIALNITNQFLKISHQESEFIEKIERQIDQACAMVGNESF